MGTARGRRRCGTSERKEGREGSTLQWIPLGCLPNRGGAAVVLSINASILDQSKNLVTVNCLRFSQVMLPCPRKPNSLFNRISASMYVCVYTCVITYNIILLLSFFFAFILLTLSCSYYFPFINYNSFFSARKKTRIFLHFILEYYHVSQKPTQL